MGAQHWFIDETKAGSYTFAVVAIDAGDVGKCRSQMSRLRRPGQKALHFKLESPATRERAYRVIGGLPLAATLVSVSGLREMQARERGLRWIARDATAVRPQRIIIERDESIEKHDQRWLREELRGYREIEHQHLGKNVDPLLSVADGIAWAFQKGGNWRDMIAHLINRSVDLS